MSVKEREKNQQKLSPRLFINLALHRPTKYIFNVVKRSRRKICKFGLGNNNKDRGELG